MGRIQRRRAKRRRRKLIYRSFFIGVLFCLVILIGYQIKNHFMVTSMNNEEQYIEPGQKEETSSEAQVTEGKLEEVTPDEDTKPNPEEIKSEVVITSTGDSLLGSDEIFGYEGRIPDILAQNNYDLSYFYSNVSHIFKKMI